MRSVIGKTFTASPGRTAASSVPVLTVSSAPSVFYRQHHAVEAPAIDEREFRPGWRVKSKLVLLLEYERIDRRQLEAALAFKGWVESRRPAADLRLAEPAG